MPRYVIEGTWSGYRPGQQRVVHREAITDRDRFCSLSSIIFSDGTTLNITIRECKHRERVKPILAYSTLIRDAAATKQPIVKAWQTGNDMRKEPRESKDVAIHK